MKKILGLDLGTNSIGWALVNEAENSEEKSSIIQLGVRVNPLTVDEQQNFEKGKSITTNADRTLKRSMRRNLHRYKLRRENLVEILKENGFISDETILSENGNRTTFETYRLRSKAATEEISLEEFARVLLMINKKRGYKSSRKAKGQDEGQLIDGMEVAKILYNENLTPGQFCLQLLLEGKKYLPDFYRSDLQAEFDKIWTKQKEFYPEILTDELKENLRGKNEKATWAICKEPFNIVGVARTTKGEELKKENFAWRAKALSEKMDLESLAVVLQKVNGQINNSSGYLGEISDRSKELYFNKQTVGQYQMAILAKNPNASLRNMVFYRQDYLDEFNTIWDKQANYHSELTEELKNEIRDIIIFYQRRLKSQKGLISFCEFESRKIEVEIDEKNKTKTIGSRVIPRSSPLFQEFKIWQVLNNLEFTDKSTGEIRILDEDEKQLLFNKLQCVESLSVKEITDILFDKSTAKNISFNFKEKVQGNITRAKLVNILGDLSEELLFDLWHLLYSWEGENTDLAKKLTEKFGYNNEIASQLSNIAFQDDYGSLSAKAIKKILPYLKEGNKYDVAVEYAGYGKHSKSSLTKEELDNKIYKDKLEILPKNSLRNPVVEKILNQMINVVNSIIADPRLGKPDEIRIELARELKKSAKEREELTKSIGETTRAHEEYRKILTKPLSEGGQFGLSSVSRNDIIRYKLWLELAPNAYKTLYSNVEISPAKLFSGDFDIEHIIPQSRLFDDSFSNKTLESRTINIEKGNKTAYDFVKEKYSENGLEDYLKRIEMLFKDKRGKLKKLKTTEKDIPDGFLNRDLGDTQYIAKYAKTMLEDLVRFVVSSTGSVTDRLREDWQLVDVMKELNWEKYKNLGLTEEFTNEEGHRIRRIKDWTKRNDHRHHAMDALTVAFTKRSIIQYLNNLNARSDRSSSIYGIEQKELYRNDKGKLLFKPPFALGEFRAEAKKHLENTLISIKAKNKVVTQNINTTKKASGTNRKIQQTPRGQLHNETIYGSIKQPEVKTDKKTGKKRVEYKTVYTIRKEISPDLKLDKVIDKGIQEILRNRLNEFNGDAKKAFSNLEENPIWLNKEKKISIKRVTISGISNAESLHDKRDKDGNLILDENGNTQAVDFVSTSNNHHIAVFRKADGNLDEQVVSFFEAVARRNTGISIIDKDYKKSEGYEFLFSMKQNEYFVFPNTTTGFNPKEVDLLNPENYALISPNLFRVQKFSHKNYVFRHHLETTVADFSANLKGITWTDFRSSKGLDKIVKIRVNHIGQIISVGEY
ncbi:MAG: type II CRISPR RNA-guided endonuclease Cas9 [Prevotellaceae bacterium]|jgi:CRISPR-associated endonuclease Csn1|nr:type II CRISPR RNA-guided endonuclease Cas9 [Prevotellaceae bacterium]